MDTTARSRDEAASASVLALGLDRTAEASLLQRMASSCGRPASVSLTEDFERCTVVVARDDSAMLRIAMKTAAARPQLVFLIADADGRLRNGRLEHAVELDDASLCRLVIGRRNALEQALETLIGSEAPLAQQLHDRVSAASGCAALVQGRSQRLLIDFDRRLAIPVDPARDSDPGELAASFPQMRLQPMSIENFQFAFADNHALAMTPLLWDLAQRDTGLAPLLPPLAAGSVISLRQWPDFRALAHRHDHFRLCCLLLKRASTAAEAAKMLSMDFDGVARFFSAAYLSGYADIKAVRDRTAALPVAGDERPVRQSALSRMWMSLRLGLQGAKP